MSRIHKKRSDERGGLMEAKKKQTQAGEQSRAEKSGAGRPKKRPKTSVSQSGGAAAGLQQVFSILAGTASLSASRTVNWVLGRSLFCPPNVPRGEMRP